MPDRIETTQPEHRAKSPEDANRDVYNARAKHREKQQKELAEKRNQAAGQKAQRQTKGEVQKP